MTRIPDEEIVRGVVKLNERILGVIFGLLAGAGLLAVTWTLVIKGGPNPGPHLGLLSQYFPGYSVTWTGGIIGFFYAFGAGFLTGFVLGAFYNKLAR